MSLLVDPDWSKILSQIDIPDGRNLKVDLELQFQLVLSLIFFLGITVRDLIAFLCEAPNFGGQRGSVGPNRNGGDRAIVTNLPSEILHDIFDLAVLPHFFLDASLAAGPESVWAHNLRTMKSVMQVCRLWYEHAVGFLYKHVYIRRPHQSRWLLNSLQGRHVSVNDGKVATSSLENLVQGIHVICSFYPPGHDPLPMDEEDSSLDEWAMYNELGVTVFEIMNLCPNVTTVEFEPPRFALPKPPSITPLLLGLPSSMTSLILHVEQPFDRDLSRILIGLSTRLTFLSIEVGRSSPDAPPAADGKIEFPVLETLIIQRLSLLRVAALWSLPSLSRLAYSPWEYNLGESEIESEDLRLLLERHGSRLIYFHLTYRTALFVFETDGLLALIFEHCPRLEHLVVPPTRLFMIPDGAHVPENLKLIELHVPSTGAFFYSQTEDPSPIYQTVWSDVLFDNSNFVEQIRKKIPSIWGIRGLVSIPTHLYQWLNLERDPYLGLDEPDNDAPARESAIAVDMFSQRLEYTSTMVKLKIAIADRYDSDEENHSDDEDQHDALSSSKSSGSDAEFTGEPYVPGTYPSSDSGSELEDNDEDSDDEQ